MAYIHVHTCFSLLDSTIKLRELVSRVKELGVEALCVTEHGNLYSSVELYKLCQEYGVKYIMGCEMYITPQHPSIKNKENKYNHLVVIAKNETGRLNLIKLVSEGNKYKYYGKPRIDYNMLLEHKDGLIVTAACLGGEVQRAIMDGDIIKATNIALKYKNDFGDDYYLELQSHRDDEQRMVNRKLLKMAKELDIKYIITPDAHYLTAEDQKYHNVFVQIGQAREAGEFYTDCYIQTEEEVYQFCDNMTREEVAFGLAMTEEIADKCNVTIPLSAPIMPHINIPDQFKDEMDYLKYLCVQGFRNKKIDTLPIEKQREYLDRLKYEISTIREMGFEGYYLLVESYANSVRRRGIARGSGGGSLVAYLTNIVDIDPVKYGLYFERFLDVGALELLKNGTITKEQLKIPDVDLDFGKQDRNNIMNNIVEQYGLERVAALGSFQYIWAKGAIKDIGKVLGISFETTNKMTKNLGDESIEEALELGLLDEYKGEYPELFVYAEKLAGLPKSFSMHPCFTEGALVMTNTGYKKIEDIRVGDNVLTHKNRFKLVAKTMQNKSDDIHTIKAYGMFDIKCTGNHPFYVRHRNEGRLRTYSDPEWVDARDIKKSDMLGIPINTENIIPTYKDLPTNDKDFWWIVGRYIGDGWCEYYEQPRNEKRAIICCDKNTDEELNEIINKVSKFFDYRYVEERTTYKLFIKNDNMFEFLHRFGKYAHGKRFTNDIFDLPKGLLEAFLDGYVSADGYIDKDERINIKTVSYELANGIIHCVAKVYNKSCGASIIKAGKDTIEGRTVNRREKYVVSYAKVRKPKDRDFYDKDNNYVWCYVKSNEREINQKPVSVYNLSVLDDNTYTVNNIAVHNCGKIIAMEDIITYNAVEISDDGELVLQGDMHTAEDLGLVKIDILGLRTVDVIYDVLDMIGKDYEYIAPHNLDFNDKKVFENFRNGFTDGIFQFESDGMKKTLENIEVSELNDLFVANALYRPGSMKFIENYALRKKGLEEYEFLHPDLEDILGNTYGIIVFQEQLIEIGRLAKLTNPDELRQATAKKKDKLLAKLNPELYDGLQKRGWTVEQLDTLWDIMLDFAKYSFNLSHSAAYAIIAYICMYLKTYHPKEFICAWINSYGGKIDKLPVCKREAQRLGIPLKVGDWRSASSICTVKDEHIEIGTLIIKFCNTSIAEELKLFSNNNYNYFVDLIRDVKMNTTMNNRQLKILTSLNFFSEFGRNNKLLAVLEEYDKRLKNKNLKETTVEKRLVELKEFELSQENKNLDAKSQVQSEKESLGFESSVYPNVPENIYMVTEIDDKYTPKLRMYRLKDGLCITMKCKKNDIKLNPFGEFSVIKVQEITKKNKTKKVDGEWVKTDEKEIHLASWTVVM